MEERGKRGRRERKVVTKESIRWITVSGPKVGSSERLVELGEKRRGECFVNTTLRRGQRSRGRRKVKWAIAVVLQDLIREAQREAQFMKVVISF